MWGFMSRIFWLELNIPKRLVKKTFEKYFGTEDYIIENREEAIKLLIDTVNKIQVKMLERIRLENSQNIIKNLYKILDECHHFYMRQKEARANMIQLNINGEAITDVFEQNRNISRNIIDAINIWIENSVLKQGKSDVKYDNSNFDLDYELLIDMYIYGLVSQAVSLLSLSKKFENKKLFYGLSVTPKKDIPIDVLREHPEIYFNTLMSGNQNILTPIPLTLDANSTEFGIGFKNEYGVEFLFFLAVICYFQETVLSKGEVGLIILDKADFIKQIELATNPKINASNILKNFTLTKENIASQLRRNDPIIWMVGTNKIRHELRPFILLDNGRVMISYCALEQSKQLWVSLFSNGGMCYTNKKDLLTVAIAKRNKELSDRLVQKIREKFQNHYESTFDEIDVKYNRIYGNRPINYGDFDLMFYSKTTNELFLVEAKFFSDSLTSSGIITDYEKLFIEDGYYDRCRRRYDLILEEPEPLREFLGIKGEMKVHFLFISSKPLDIEVQDKDGMVTFLCLSIFDKYLEGKLIKSEDDSIVRPVHII
ncbi:hypothetical protein [Clostridium tetani]|uniref:hypothetical protein n=1 Tax=Clostridium tetani TaxID=1513 RepID=UPI001026BCE6|nr:hypothetical protein [Clostridium tetani]RXI73906.1 hypothetical protein DP127_05165 [Clostridium tetani]BDR84446.1 hypothetical protein K254310026_18570 [Clostridium tetani]